MINSIVYNESYYFLAVCHLDYFDLVHFLKNKQFLDCRVEGYEILKSLDAYSFEGEILFELQFVFNIFKCIIMLINKLYAKEKSVQFLTNKYACKIEFFFVNN